MVNFSEIPPGIEHGENPVPSEILDDLEKFIGPALELALKREASVTVIVHNKAQAQAGQELAMRLAGERSVDPDLVKFKVIPSEEGGQFGKITDSED